MKILVLGGGTSAEREISLKSSGMVRQALVTLGHEVAFADPADGNEAVKRAAVDCDMVFPILHGGDGEDGTIQRLLDATGKPYLGSGAAASELCFHKNRLKALLAEHGLPTPRGEEVTLETFGQSPLWQKPFVLKPVADGSSVGMMIARELPYDEAEALGLLKKYGRMLLEELIVGHEITVPILGDKALPVIEIVPPEGKEFDYENKYNGATAELCPPQNVSAALQSQAQELAEQVHALSGARHLSRTDIMIDETERMYVLELNTMPGMTEQSLLPKSAAVSGLSWGDLAKRLVELTLAT